MLIRVSSYSAAYSFNEVIRMSKKIIFIDKDNIEAWRALGSAYREKNLIHESVAAYKKVFSLDPKDTEVCFDLGLTYFREGAFQRAAYYFEHIRSMGHGLDKSTESGLYNYAHQSLVMLQKCYEALGDLKKAEQMKREIGLYGGR